MRFLRGMIAGALALGGLALVETTASAQPMTPPKLINVTPAAQEQVAGAATDQPCYRPHRRYYGGYGFHPRYGYRHFGYRPYGYRPYGFRPYGYRHYGYRPYGYRPYGFHGYGHRYRY